MNRNLVRASVAVGGLACSLMLSASAVPAYSGTAPLPGSGSLCDESGDAAARGAAGTRADDHREITPAEQKAIRERTARILAAKAAGKGKPGGGGGGGGNTGPGGPKSAIPVYVHVMTSNSGAGNVTDAQIDAQIRVLNDTYSGNDVDGAAGDTGIGFTLAGVERIANNTWHADRQSTTYRSKTRQGGKNALNIWVVDFKYLGIATFPWDYASNPSIDGIRVHYASFPGGSATNYDQGETATHEAGHWLGLFHTFQGGCTGPGDEVADTAAQASPSSGCPTGRDSCTAPGDDPIHNYMDYSYDSCYFEFSAGQSVRMDQMWTAYRL